MPDSKPTPPPAVALEATTLPSDWKDRSTESRLAWLDLQPLPSKPTVSLGRCYRRAADMTQYFKLVYSILAKVRKEFVQKLAGKSADAAKYLNDFILAFNAGIGKFSKDIFLSNSKLLANGAYGETAPVSTLVEVDELTPVLTDDKGLVQVEEAAETKVQVCDSFQIKNEGLTKDDRDGGKTSSAHSGSFVPSTLLCKRSARGWSRHMRIFSPLS